MKASFRRWLVQLTFGKDPHELVLALRRALALNRAHREAELEQLEQLRREVALSRACIERMARSWNDPELASVLGVDVRAMDCPSCKATAGAACGVYGRVFCGKRVAAAWDTQRPSLADAAAAAGVK